ncbi:hypothetical protein [uncultured Ruminococcus sp.]|uniref:hypothetical protein n=1 Tax=Ruminococcus sp. TaxID=41978 RepID=UPI0026653C10|nr:hypothetical protein [uncultured Ruminococcus sp.]
MNPNTNGNQNAYHYAPGQAPRGAQTPPPYQNAPNPNPYPYQNPQWQQNPNGMPPQPPKKKRKIWPIVLIIIIAVVVILSIFSAVILVPTIVGYVKQTRKENAENECLMAVQAAQMIVSSAYAMDGTYEAEDGTEIQFDQDALADGELDITAEAADAIEELSEVDGTVISVISDEAKISYLKYRAESGQVVVYEDPDGESGSYTVK